MVHHPLFDFEPAERAHLRTLAPGMRITKAAAGRDGVLDHRQLRALGISDSAMTRRIGDGALHVRHRGVYAVGRYDLTRRGRLRAALLRYGRTAVLSHRTAATQHDLLPSSERIGAVGRQIARRRRGWRVVCARLERHDLVPPVESVLEELFLELCDRFGIPRPVCQWPLGLGGRSGRVDFVWPDLGVALGVDGRRWHAIQDAWVRDHDKDLALREAGFDPHRYTYWQVVNKGPAVAAVVLDALARGAVRSRARSAGSDPNAIAGVAVLSPASVSPPGRG